MQLQRRSRKKLIQIPLVTLLVIVVIGLAVVFGLFHIREVDVTGNEFYSADEIKTMVMSDSLSENSLYLTWKYGQPDSADHLAFLNGVEVSMINPYHVQIRVYEKTIVGYLMYSGSMVYFDKDGVVVDISPEVREGVPPFSGISIGQPAVSEKLPVEDPDFLNDIISEAQMIHQSGLQPKEIHYDDQHQLILYFDKNRVLLGSNTYMEEKLTNLAALLPQMEGLSGTLHMEDYTVGTTTITFKKGESGNEELLMNVTGPNGEAAEESPEGEQSETETETETGKAASGYTDDTGTISTDAEGNSMYTDAGGNVTYDMDKPYLGEDGQVISDGYGYIDPYTGAYFLN